MGVSGNEEEFDRPEPNADLDSRNPSRQHRAAIWEGGGPPWFGSGSAVTTCEPRDLGSFNGRLSAHFFHL